MHLKCIECNPPVLGGAPRRPDAGINSKENVSMHRAMIIKTMVSLPQDARRWLEQEAHKNASNVSAEVVRSVRDRMDRQQERDGGAAANGGAA
jgi:hypothetical protein